MTSTTTVLAGGKILANGTAWEATPADVWLKDGTISAITDPKRQPADADRVVDADGLLIMPGLIDLHCHLTFRRTIGPVWELMAEGPIPNTIRAVRNALTVLRQGVTTIRELAAPDDVNTHVAKAVQNGVFPGPRIFSAGTPLGVTGGHAKAAIALDGADAFRRETRRMIKSGASWIKIIGSNDPTVGPMENGEWSHGEVDSDELRATVETAHKWGGRVAVHTMGSRQLEVVAEAGVDTIEHGVYLSEAGASAMTKNDVTLVATLSGYLETTWPRWQRGEDWVRRHENLIAPHIDSFRLARDAGVRLAVGTDSAGEIVHELQLMHKYGCSPAECLQAATHTNAGVLGIDGRIGDIQPGMAADLLVLRGNPVDDLALLREVEMVVQGGNVARPMDIRLPSGDESGESEPWLARAHREQA